MRNSQLSFSRKTVLQAAVNMFMNLRVPYKGIKCLDQMMNYQLSFVRKTLNQATVNMFMTLRVPQKKAQNFLTR
jgi:hypothetical protein